jgi:hypothetical protein
MLTREFLYKLSGNRTALLIGQIFALIICFAYFDYYYYFNIYPDKKVKEDFAQTDCFIISKSLGSKGHLVHKYRSNFLITYKYNGVQYSRWVSGNGLDMAYTSNQAEQEDLLSQFSQGGTYQCWVDPEKPDISVLVLRHHWLSTAPLIVPTAVSVIVLYYLFTNVSVILAIRREKLRNKNTK